MFHKICTSYLVINTETFIIEVVQYDMTLSERTISY